MKRRKFSSKFKTKIVLESLSDRYTMADLAQKHQIHPNQISQWKHQFLANAEAVFENGAKSPKEEADQERDNLLKAIGQLKVENDFLKNALR